MLVLSRRPGEQLCIGDNITITVLAVHGQMIKIGINAPRSVRVLRGELQRWAGESSQAEPSEHVLPVLASHALTHSHN